ncbi:glyoxylate/hydroxypyruvate reductase A [Pseudooceanicola sp. CBS1P-1]|uniref:Glyoxylate/hydroxypyruvate reductase A n=1 Tax=Pseudooceanicola albus TaxID=2692189 RepID=A0A6L7G9U0_9RHOB|nr:MULTISPECIES: glyoxylate/hydroxypyruvate reductase A [Pseudooceanicola]MBT9386079.1 glyoxylate/hydroxypyruvate reductase A [Pseudooceanicola endophyticus]MXN19503.1 glyoxylate/hydroxypyruvate reductase A [Pseudooceanicola albus]
MTVAIYIPSDESSQEWRDRLARLLPEMTVQTFEEVTDPAAVHYAVVWKPPTGAIAGFANLRAVVSLGAGVDHVLEDRELPAHLPIIRTVGTDLTQRMREFVALQVLLHHRRLPEVLARQRAHVWEKLVTPPAPRRVVGVMGLGNIGAASAQALAGLGFDVRGWARSPHEIAGVTCFAGEDGLAPFLAGCEILVCLLPLTESTRAILNAALFAQLAPGAVVINLARGPHLVVADLLEALASGQLSGASLDVFETEPLPADDPLWDHPQIIVTPHVASFIDAETGSRLVAANIARFEAEGSVPDLADAGRGY